jgi:perosamine synthetase
MSARSSSYRTRELDPEEVVRRIRAALPAEERRVALHEPRFTGNEKRYLDDCIDTNWVSYGGSYVGRFERALAESCGAPEAIAVTSGTVALQVALHVGGVEPGDEVLVPALTFVATANAIVHAGGVPHFVDAEESTLGLSPVALAEHLDAIGETRGGRLHNRVTGRRIAALLPVHIFGHPVDMDPICEIARRYDLRVIEDATEALGSRYKKRRCGSLARLACLSFNGNKLVTTGGGGAILTDDPVIGERLRHITTTAKKQHPWAFIHDEVAWNYRMPNINAALGLAQLEGLPDALAAKRRLWDRYAEAFAGLRGIRIFREAAFAESNHWLVTLLLDDGHEHMLEPILAATNDAGLMTRPAWTPMHRLPMYLENPRAPLSATEDLSRRIINLPSSPFLGRHHAA